MGRLSVRKMREITQPGRYGDGRGLYCKVRGPNARSWILRVLSPIWTERPETARRVRQRLRAVLDWARIAGYRDGINPVEDVEKGLPRRRDNAKHLQALAWREVPAVLTRIEGVDRVSALALRFTILTAGRSGEVPRVAPRRYRHHGHGFSVFEAISEVVGKAAPFELRFASSRAEFHIFASITADQIDLTRTKARGVAHLKNFLAYAERGAVAPPGKDEGSLGPAESQFE